MQQNDMTCDARRNDMTWCQTKWYDMWCQTKWYDMWCQTKWYDMWCQTKWYDMWCQTKWGLYLVEKVTSHNTQPWQVDIDHDNRTLLRVMRLSYGTPGLVMMLHSEEMFIVGISLLYWMTPSKMSARLDANQKMSFFASRGLHDEKSFSSLASWCLLINRSTALKASLTFSTHCR